MRTFRSAALAVTGMAVATLAVPANAAPVFDFVNSAAGGAEAGTQAREGFEKAGALWSSILDDNVTIRVAIGFADLRPGVLASAGSARFSTTFANTYAALAADATTLSDVQAVANLPGVPFSYVTNEPGNCTNIANPSCGAIDSRIREIDNDNTADNFNMRMTRANAKALGLLADDGVTIDVGITFSSNFTFDFDRVNGIDDGAFDFVGIAMHEIGHALGFVSGVDIMDVNALPGCPGCGPGGVAGLDNIGFVETLDLFRYDEFEGAMRNSLAVGGNPCLSITGGEDCFALMSSGRFNGDGQQASHFKDNLSIGIMDPTLSRGEFADVTAFDRLAFDIIGWDVNDNILPTPAPGVLALFGLGLGAMAMRRRRKSG